MPDFLPRFHHPEPGLYIFLGYSGRGLALSSAIGAELAAVPAVRQLCAARLAGADYLLGFSPRRRTQVAYGRLLDRFGR